MKTNMGIIGDPGWGWVHISIQKRIPGEQTVIVFG